METKNALVQLVQSKDARIHAVRAAYMHTTTSYVYMCALAVHVDVINLLCTCRLCCELHISKTY